uniref:Uncharacterized protein n=1 Tax=viral metagenome TaxID=1070528 RepID=A0A6C0I3J4_9ZZZZ
MGGYFSSIKVDEAVSATNVTNDAEHDDVLVLSAKIVDPLEIILNNENNVDENIVITVEEKKDLDLSSSSSCSGYEIRTTANDVVYYTKMNKKKNKNKKNKGKGINK